MRAPVRTLDDYVEAFERARQVREAVALEEFLPAAADPLYSEVLRELVRIDLEFGWESNRPRSLEDYRERFPGLFDDPDSLQAVAFEEYRLRRRAGQTPNPQDYARRYGVRTDDWPAEPADSLGASLQGGLPPRTYHGFRLADPLEGSIRLDGPGTPGPMAGEGIGQLFRGLLLADRHSGGRLADGLAALPRAGTSCLGFELVADLGAGAFGKVFLARQAALADRLVALKVSPDVGTESQALARLQHTHIVPIYSVHRTGPLQAVCMPYCGAVTLADVVRDLQCRTDLPRDGTALLAVLANKARPVGAPAGRVAPAIRAALAGRTYAEAVLWLGGCLAGGLAHAHERGIMHRDVKPANVLLTDEGLPMLLDFNVAEDAKQGGAAEALVGGTLPYMAPEQLAVFRARAGRIDDRADVYSLGIVLFELLTGRFPFSPVRLPPGSDNDSALDEVLAQALAERQGGPPCPRRWNPEVSPALASIVRHCLEPGPERRYPSAAALREDVERHLAHLPLRYAPEPSPAERLRKWARRNPRLPLRLSLAAAALLLLAAAGLGWRAQRLDGEARAETERQAFAGEFRLAQFLLSTKPDTARQHQEGEEACLRALARYGVLEGPHWRHHWRLTALPAERQREVKGQLGELLLLLGRTTVEAGGAIEQALEYNRRAEDCLADDVPAALWRQRAHLHAKAGQAEEARRDQERARLRHQGTVRDRLLEARDLVAAARHGEARRLLELVVLAEPDNYWAHFLLGICHDGLAQGPRAVTCYTICVALEPRFHGAYLNRGMAYLRDKEYDRAKADLDRVIEMVPGRAETYWDRALALLRDTRQQALTPGRKKELQEALADLDRAEALGIGFTRIHFLRARLRREAGDEAGARRSEAEGLKRRPTDELSWSARGYFKRRTDPKGALADYDEALKINPRSRAALMGKAEVLADRLNRPKDANRVLQELLRHYPNHVPALSGQAVVLARLHKRAEAHQRIDEALALNPTGEVYYHAACTYALTGPQAPDDAEKALAYLRRALDASFGRTFFEDDADLASLRDMASFRRLGRGMRLLRPEAP